MIDKQFKISYNQTLERYHKAEKFFNNNNITFDKKSKYFEEFNNVVMTLSLYMKEFTLRYGREMTDKEINEGFKEEIYD